MTSWSFGKHRRNSKSIFVSYYLFDSVFNLFPIRPRYIKEFIKKIVNYYSVSFS